MIAGVVAWLLIQAADSDIALRTAAADRYTYKPAEPSGATSGSVASCRAALDLLCPDVGVVRVQRSTSSTQVLVALYT